MPTVPTAVATIGEAAIGAPSRNVIPGRIRFTLDVRDPKAKTLDVVESELRAELDAIAGRRKLTIELTRIWRKEPVPFDAGVVGAVEAATKGLGFSHRRMVSGAGHDACNIAALAPTAMIFVPCRDGISHNEAESATQGDCTAGADVLLQTLLTPGQFTGSGWLNRSRPGWLARFGSDAIHVRGNARSGLSGVELSGSTISLSRSDRHAI